MAIAYKSAGAGVGTETSGAALSPLCPATVDVGDILVAHVYWEGTTTAPSTPSGWTLLNPGGTPYVIETTIGRHWVFGRIADGSEDGASVAFGNPAVTTQRGARIYSFSGRVSGTITQLIPSSSFSHISDATDPQMPTVTTTKTGARAVALVAQNDNNAHNAVSGAVSGGTWTEAVAEFSANLTPGFTLSINTSIPTADPGTISGGVISTANDPCGSIGFQILDSPPNVEVLAESQSLTLTTFDATVKLNKNVVAESQSLLLTTFDATVKLNRHVQANQKSLILTTYPATIEAGGDTEVNAGVVNLLLTTFDAAISLHKNVVAASKSLVLTTFDATVKLTRHVQAGFKELVLTTFSANVNASRNVQAVTKELVLTTYPATVSVVINTNVQAECQELVLTTYPAAVSLVNPNSKHTRLIVHTRVTDQR